MASRAPPASITERASTPVQVLVDGTREAVAEPPPLDVFIREVERMNLALQRQDFPGPCVEDGGRVRRGRRLLDVPASGDDQAQAAGGSVLAIPERRLPTLSSRGERQSSGAIPIETACAS